MTLTPLSRSCFLYNGAVVPVAGKAVGLPADDQVKGALCAVIDHLPELGAVVCFAADMAIHILAQDGHAMGADVGLAVPALALDGLLRLAAAARRSGSRRQGGAVCSLFFWPQKLLADLLADAHEVWYTGCVSRQRGIDCVVFLRHAPHARPAAFIVQGCRDFCFAIFRKYAQKSDSKLAKLTLTKGGQIVYNKTVTNI